MRFSKKQQSGSTLLFFIFWKRILSSRYLPNVHAPLTDSSLHWKISIKIKKTVSDYKSFATTRKVSFWTFTIRHIVSSSRTTREDQPVGRFVQTIYPVDTQTLPQPARSFILRKKMFIPPAIYPPSRKPSPEKQQKTSLINMSYSK